MGTLLFILHTVGAVAIIKAAIDPWYCAGGSAAFAVPPPPRPNAVRAEWVDSLPVVFVRGFGPVGRRGRLPGSGQCATIERSDELKFSHSITLRIINGAKKEVSSFVDIELPLDNDASRQRRTFVADVGMHHQDTIRYQPMVSFLDSNFVFILTGVSDRASAQPLHHSDTNTTLDVPTSTNHELVELWKSNPIPDRKVGRLSSHSSGKEARQDRPSLDKTMERVAVDVSGVRRLRLEVNVTPKMCAMVCHRFAPVAALSPTSRSFQPIM